jgi:hypothetical protein
MTYHFVVTSQAGTNNPIVATAVETRNSAVMVAVPAICPAVHIAISSFIPGVFAEVYFDARPGTVIRQLVRWVCLLTLATPETELSTFE